jgi:hypothetical protein
MKPEAHTNGEVAVVKTLRTSRLLEDAAILDDGLTPQLRERARLGCFLHLRDLAISHPEFAPPRAVEFVRQWEAAARERLREREERKSVHAD